MGYTHYWTIESEIGDNAWICIRDEARKLIAASPIKLTLEEGDETVPRIDDSMIQFNAFDEDEAHETFVFTRHNAQFEFCKTARKQYDKVVCGILAVAKEYAGDLIDVSSDGKDDAWRPQLDWASEVLGRTLKRPF